MGMISSDEVEEFDKRLKGLFEKLKRSKQPTPDDAEAAREFLNWVIYPNWDNGELDVRPIAWSDGLAETERQTLANVAFAAAELVKEPGKMQKTILLGLAERLVEARGIPILDGKRGKPRPVLDKETEARDRFVYEKLCSGLKPKQIRNLLDNHPTWALLEDDEAIRQCGTDYAERHELTPPR